MAVKRFLWTWFRTQNLKLLISSFRLFIQIQGTWCWNQWWILHTCWPCEIFVFVFPIVLLSLGGTSYNQTNLCHLRYTKKKCEVSHEHKTTKLFILLLYAIESKGGREWRLWHIVMKPWSEILQRFLKAFPKWLQSRNRTSLESVERIRG